MLKPKLQHKTITIAYGASERFFIRRHRYIWIYKLPKHSSNSMSHKKISQVVGNKAELSCLSHLFRKLICHKLAS